MGKEYQGQWFPFDTKGTLVYNSSAAQAQVSGWLWEGAENEKDVTMHELSVTQGMLEIVLRHAQQAGAQRITQIHLIIGDLSSIVDDSVQFYFDFISQDTIAEGAQLVFQRVPATFRCRGCGNTFTSNERDFTCPNCKEISIEVIAGKEFRVESIEVE